MPVQRARRRLRKCKFLVWKSKFYAFPALTSPPVTCNIEWMDSEDYIQADRRHTTKEKGIQAPNMAGP
jgi:carbonic anhydrase